MKKWSALAVTQAFILGSVRSQTTGSKTESADSFWML